MYKHELWHIWPSITLEEQLRPQKLLHYKIKTIYLSMKWVFHFIGPLKAGTKYYKHQDFANVLTKLYM